MKSFRYMPALAALCGLLSGCATPTTSSPQGDKDEIARETKIQSKLAYERFLLDEARLHNVAYPILKANADLCPDNVYEDGTRLWTYETAPELYRDGAKEDTGLDETIMIYAVVPGSAADAAGVRPGDKLLAIQGRALPAGRKGLRALDDALGDLVETRDITLTLDRGGERQTAYVSRDLICAYAPVYDPDDQSVNASANGAHIILGRGMLRFAENDTELATVVAHEIAHDAMQHSEKQEQNMSMGYAAGLAADLLIAAAGGISPVSMAESGAQLGAGAYSVGFETEADYVGLYFMARAGYDTSSSANFWRRMSSENNKSSITMERSHPTSPARFLALEKTNLEIAGKKQAGQPLIPAIEKPDPRQTTGKRGFN